jgi:hypothetical protein
MNDADGPEVAELVYDALFTVKSFNSDIIPYALDLSIQRLRMLGVPPSRWATFVHIGA